MSWITQHCLQILIMNINFDNCVLMLDKINSDARRVAVNITYILEHAIFKECSLDCITDVNEVNLNLEEEVIDFMYGKDYD